MYYTIENFTRPCSSPDFLKCSLRFRIEGGLNVVYGKNISLGVYNGCDLKINTIVIVDTKSGAFRLLN